MEYNDWDSLYQRIEKEFHYPREKEEEAALALSHVLESKNLLFLGELDVLIREKNIFVFGAGPSLESSLLLHREKLCDSIKIAADGATSALLKKGILPDIIVTDLDGKITDQLQANLEGTPVVVHAHGDNIEHIKHFVPQFEGSLVGTIQINPAPYGNVYNFGGFTDGDRAAFLADHFQAKDISLVGFDYHSDIGEYSFAENKDRNTKIRKLRWCQYLIESLHNPNVHYL